MAADASIRAALARDASAIAEFQATCWREAYRGLVPDAFLDALDPIAAQDRWHDLMVSGIRPAALAESNGSLVGVVSWRASIALDAPALELTSLYVAAATRGSGVAGRLLHHAIGGAPAYLWVFAANPRARAFYARHGFRPDGRQQIDPGTGVPEMRYVRP